MSDQALINLAARNTALQAMHGLQLKPTAVVEFSSRGRLLIVGEEAAWVAATRVKPPLQAQVLSSTLRPQTLDSVAGMEYGDKTELHLKGHLGAYELTLEQPGADPQIFQADLVLDLGDQPLLNGRLPPPGYVAAGPEQFVWEQALVDLSELVGVFEKPTYFQYDPSICAHARNGITACTQCLDACPTEAIVSIGERVEVNPNLCQGLGSCATVCPSGAIRYAYPAPDDGLGFIRRLLESYRAAGGSGPRLLLHDAAQGGDWVGLRLESLPSDMIPLALEEIGSLGLEAWLSALAFGAAELIILATPEVPAKVLGVVQGQLEICSALLEGMGYRPDQVRLIRPTTADALIAELQGEPPPVVPAATYAVSDEKRAMAFWALDHLHAHAPQQRPVITLPAGAPFGAAEVSEKACTLCLACVSACPGQALQDGYDRPELRFIESNCLQCGMCTRVCPEDAIWISPRFLFDAEARRQPRVLYQEQPFECVSCGKAFATRSVITRMLSKLEGHYMFREERAKRRLQMCEDCRVVDIAQDPEALEAGMRPPMPQ